MKNIQVSLITKLSGFLIILGFFNTITKAQTSVQFRASDSLLVTADLYMEHPSYPYILLFHQQQSSRGEFRSIAPKLNKLHYNCLAVDLRVGEDAKFIKNETAQRAKSAQMVDAQKDIIGAINYIKHRAENKKMVLFGSGFSSALCLRAGEKYKSIEAVVVFSPGNFFENQFTISEIVKNYKKPIFIACSKDEASYTNGLFSVLNDKYKYFFVPQSGDGDYGAKALWNDSDSFNAYWLNLLQFLRKQN